MQCPDGSFTTDASKVCKDNTGLTVTKYVYVQPATIIPDGTVISQDTTWTMDKSPYYVAGSVQVASGARLTIADGAIVEGLKPVPCTADCVGTMPATGVINVAGALVVGGKYQTQLLGLMVSNLTEQTGGGTVSIQYGLLEDTFLQISNVQPFTMMHTTAYRLNVTPKVQSGVTTYQSLNNFGPSFSSAYIKYNTFIDSAGFHFDPSDTIQYNLFLNLVSPLVLINTSMPTDPNALTRQNSFLFKHGSSNTNRVVVETYGHYDSWFVYTLNFTNNYWGTTDTTVIGSRVADSMNTSNPQLPNVIDYSNPAMVPDVATPPDPQSGIPNE